MSMSFRWSLGPTRLEDYGGGGGDTPTKRKIYFYLIIDSSNSTALSRDDIQSFYKIGARTGEDYIFTLIDIGTDKRLATDLSRSDAGQMLLERLRQETPSLIVTDQHLSKYEKASTINVVSFEQFSGFESTIYERMNIHPRTFRLIALDFLRNANRWVHLKPNILGFGLNLNEVIIDVIKRLERDTP